MILFQLLCQFYILFVFSKIQIYVFLKVFGFDTVCVRYRTVLNN